MKVNANVILVKCKADKLYGMRVEERNGDWIRTWAFPIKEDLAIQEGFDKVKINGSFGITDEYPGCPYCETNQFCVCGQCEKISCYHGGEMVTCAWCGRTLSVQTKDKLVVTGGGY